MSRCTLLILFIIYIPEVLAEDGNGEFWKWDSFVSNPLIISAFFIFLFASINYLIDLFKKDKILKKLLRKYLVFQMKDDSRYRGTMRLERDGIEIISEESRQRGHAASYIFNKIEMNTIKAYIRYLDSMNENEKIERDWDLDRVYHPSFLTRLLRKIRNFWVALKDSVRTTIQMIWGSFQKMKAFEPMQRQRGNVKTVSDLDEIEKSLVDYALDESYERLIERFVGTRIKVDVEGANKVDVEGTNKVDVEGTNKVDVEGTKFTAILKEYNAQYMYLMDIRQENGQGYSDQWEVNFGIGGTTRDERGMRCRTEGDRLFFENNTPYDILIGNVKLHDGSPDFVKEFKYEYRVPAFNVQHIFLRPGDLNQTVPPFQKIITRQRRTYRNFKQVHVQFKSIREADIVFPRKYCHIIESAEKHETQLLDLETLTEKILVQKEAADITITDAKGNPIKGINVIHGYITNINEDRIDIKEIGHSYARRWSIEHAFNRLDDKMRRFASKTVRILPGFRKRMIAQIALVSKVGRKKAGHKPIGSLLFSPASPRIRPHIKSEMPLKTIVLTGNVTDVEFPVIQQFEKIENHHMLYQETQRLQSVQIAKSHIVWLGHGEIYKEKYQLNIDAEHRIKTFVSRGGIVITSGQDVTGLRRRSAGWIPEPLIAIEREETTQFKPTYAGKNLFQYPNKIKSGNIKMDDMWTGWNENFQLYAYAHGRDDAAVLLLKFQAGLYIITSLKNETSNDIEVNQKMIQNLMYFAVKWYDRQKHKNLYYF